MTTYSAATLDKGRVEVGHRVHFTIRTGPHAGAALGDVCETRHAGREHPCAVVKLSRSGELRCVQFDNVAPGARQKRNASV